LEHRCCRARGLGGLESCAGAKGFSGRRASPTALGSVQVCHMGPTMPVAMLEAHAMSTRSNHHWEKGERDIEQ
jgi:hypothetical protein